MVVGEGQHVSDAIVKTEVIKRKTIIEKKMKRTMSGRRQRRVSDARLSGATRK